MDGIRIRKLDSDMTRYGNFYILRVDIAGLEYGFTLVAEDFSYVDCNGNTYDVPIAHAKDKN